MGKTRELMSLKEVPGTQFENVEFELLMDIKQVSGYMSIEFRYRMKKKKNQQIDDMKSNTGSSYQEMDIDEYVKNPNV
jgi:hypothetical protein